MAQRCAISYMHPRPLHTCYTQRPRLGCFGPITSIHPHACHGDDDSNNERCRPPNGTCALSAKYSHPLVHTNGSDLCGVRTVGMNCVVIDVDDHLASGQNQGQSPTRQLTRDLDALKACSLACHSWYIAVVPHLHHTLILRGKSAGKARSKLEPLSKLHKLGLMSLIKEIRVDPSFGLRHWFVPHAFSRRDLRHFSTFTNVQTLKLGDLKVHRFIPGIERYFEHFSPTLQSVVLYRLHCTPRQLSYFLSLFPNLDNIKIGGVDAHVPNTTIPINTLSYLLVRTLRAPHHFLWWPTVPLYEPAQCCGLGTCPVGGVCRNPRDATILPDGHPI